MKIPYFLPDYDGEEYKAMIRVMNSGHMSMGCEVEALEEEFRAIEGCEYCLTVNSATSGLYIASLCSSYNKAVVPSNTFIATYQAAKMAGKKIEICDVFYNEYYGWSFDSNSINYKVYIGGKYKLYRFKDDGFIIGDCAHRVPGVEKKVITALPWGEKPYEYEINQKYDFGNIWVYSFHGNKNIHSNGGGMICTNNKEYYDKMKALRYHGFNNRNGYKYNCKADAGKYEMNDLTACIVREQLKKLDWKQQERRRVYEIYYNNLKDIVYMDSPSNHSFHLAIIELPSEGHREHLEMALTADGVEYSMHYRPLHIVAPELYKKKYDNYNHTKRYKRWLSLPIYPKLSSAEVNYICDIVRSVV